MTAGGMDADNERTRMYPQRVMCEGYLCDYSHNTPLLSLFNPVTAQGQVKINPRAPARPLRGQ